MGEARRTIIVHAFDCDNGGVDFNMSGFGVRNHEIECSKENPKDGMKKGDPHKVTFELNNRSSKDLCFPTDPTRAIWVSSNANDCPKTTPPPHGEFPARKMKVSDDREQLTLENLNSCAAQYKFALNFTDPNDRGEQLVESYDPIWNNQNGGRL